MNEVGWIKIAIDSSNNLHLFWVGITAGSGGALRGRYIKYSGGSWGSIEEVPFSNSGEDREFDMAIDSNGNVYVICWVYNENKVFIRTRTSSWGNSSQLNSYDCLSGGVAVAIDSNNYAHYIWKERASSTDHYLKHNTGGNTETIERSSTIQFTNTGIGISIDSDNYLYVIQNIYTASQNEQYRYYKYTNSWSSPVNLFSDASTTILYRSPASVLWANYPIVSNCKTNRPKTGYLFIYNRYDGSNTTLRMSYEDLTWESPVVAPTVTTQAVSSIDKTTATGNGTITDDGGEATATRGMCWKTSSGPTVSDSHATNGTGEGAYTVSMTGLLPNTHYYVRAYSINSAGTSYGAEVEFTTLSDNAIFFGCNC